MTDMTQVGRLAMRQEGNFWNAYYALEGTMEGAIHIGSIQMGAVIGNRGAAERKQAFMDLMREVVADIIEEKIGVRPVWGGPERAPESERAGHG